MKTKHKGAKHNEPLELPQRIDTMNPNRHTVDIRPVVLALR